MESDESEFRIDRSVTQAESRQRTDRRRRRLGWLLGLSLAAACASPKPVEEPRSVTTLPVPSSETRAAAAGWLDGRPWTSQHEDICALGRPEGLELVLLGDSITQSWGGPGRRVGAPGQAVWDECFAGLRVGNFGISGDRTQHVLWRLAHGALDGLEPRSIVLMIGTNNLPHDSPADVARGIEAIVEELLERCPQASIVLHGVAPRGELPDDPMRRATQAIAQAVRPLAEHPRVTWLDLGPWLLLPDGRADPRKYRGDFLHLSVEGYRAWGRALATVLP